ncbi:MAG: EamA family transporter [Burkholderiaceae bacterium]|nr:EamA family transporter [Sulfuritalea sp.]MCF8176511.1 EamA family transporter [Burkholderiaceae bacterium]
MTASLPLRHFLLALAVVAVWGSNFVVIKLALGHLPPLLFAALRFSFAVIPAALLLKPPKASWRNLALYGVLIGVGQFGVLYIAMQGHISPGLASLVLQSQVFFTIGLSMWLTGEKVRGYQWLALLLATGGIGVIVMHTDGSTTLLGLLLVLVAGLGWAGGNTVARRAGRVDMLAYMVWSSVFALPPLFALSFLFEGWEAILSGVQAADRGTWLAVAWQGWGNTLFGFAAWSWLLARHPTATIAPLALLIPVFGMGSSALWLGEPLPAWKLIAASLVLSGLTLNLFWPMWRSRPR